VVPPPERLRVLGPLVVVDGECPYFKDGRANATVFSLPAERLQESEYEAAMAIGMRRSGSLIYRPVCPSCRKCQPFRLDVERFALSRSQKRVQKRCEGLFDVTVGPPQSDAERRALYARYQRDQHGADGQSADEESYERFLCETVAHTIELAWRDKTGALVAVGILDVVPGGLSTVYFYWEPSLRDLSLGVYSALHEIDLVKKMGKRYYYLGYLVPGSQTMSYKASFAGGEVWSGDGWTPVPSRDLEDEGMKVALLKAEQTARKADARTFRFEEER
jgi:leucyl-tRNA---protein transferase